MKKLFFTANVMLILALSACNQKVEQKTDTGTAAPERKKMEVKLTDLASAKDFVCGMPVEEGGIADTASYEGKLYGFCSAECKAEFAKNPSSYLAQK